MELEIAFSLGLFGSLHCIGMCGPILLALPTEKSLKKQFFSKLLYHISRSLGYALLGIVFGIIGTAADLLGLQKVISIASGLIIIFILLQQKFWAGIEAKLYESRLIKFLKMKLSAQFSKKGILAQISTGFLNSLLPCGFVYLGLLGSLNQNSLESSALFMLFFGFGTIPLMLSYSLFTAKIRSFQFLKSPKIKTTLSAFLAVFFILRGLEVGIPYLSPKFDIHEKHVESSCCDN